MALFWKLAACAVAVVAFVSVAKAQSDSACSVRLTRENLVPCALGASSRVRVQRAGALAVAGRVTTARAVLPSNPVLALTGAQRRSVGGAEKAFNWSATLSQEIEIGGQRASRLRAAEAELQAAEQRLRSSRREAAIEAWRAFFEVIAAREQQQLSERLLDASRRMSEVTRARAQKGIAASVDADVAEAATLHALQAKLAAERTLGAALARIRFLTSVDAAAPASVEGELTPLPGLPDTPESQKISDRPELLSLDAERRAWSARAQTLRRSRVPSPTLSAFAQSDGFDERVFGVGLAVPIPLPGSMSRGFAGEIAEAEALASQAIAERDAAERELRLEIASASANLASHQRAVDALEPAALERAEAVLKELATQIDAGRISAREALVFQQPLIELLQNNIEERKALCLASLELARALGLPLEGDAR